MITNNIKNSSGKIIGYTQIDENEIIICTQGKPILQITDSIDIQKIKSKDISDNFLIHLYDDYYLSNGEIASLYGVCYSNINSKLKSLPTKTSSTAGRRNRAFGTPVSIQQSQRMSIALKGRKAPPAYERTPKIREKISNSLKQYFKEHPQNPEPHRANWENGVYANVDFHRGIGGHFYSIKNKCQFNFRSLLELSYMLQLEEDSDIINYDFEPVHIKCENNTIYTPDLLINNYQLIELKSKKYLHSLSIEDYNRFVYKCQQGEKYAEKNNLQYRVIYDEDIGFDSRQMKRHLQNHPEIIQTFQIIFNQPERIWS